MHNLNIGSNFFNSSFLTSQLIYFVDYLAGFVMMEIMNVKGLRLAVQIVHITTANYFVKPPI